MNEIREVWREAWAQGPGRAIGAVLLAPAVVVFVWILAIVGIVAGTPA